MLEMWYDILVDWQQVTSCFIKVTIEKRLHKVCKLNVAIIYLRCTVLQIWSHSCCRQQTEA